MSNDSPGGTGMVLLAISFILTLAPLVAADPLTTRPASKPFSGLTVRDHVSGTLVATHIAPGPLEGRGYRSPKILRADTIVSVNGQAMNARQFNAFIESSKVGDVVTLEVKRTGSTVVSGSLDPVQDGPVELVKFTVADGWDWVGPVNHPKPDRATFESRVETLHKQISPTTQPTQLESLIDTNLANLGVSEPIDRLLAMMGDVQRKSLGFHSLSRIAHAFEHPKQLLRLEKHLTDPLPAIAADPRQFLVQAAAMIDVEPPALRDPIDLSDPQRAVDALAECVDRGGEHVRRAFADVTPDRRARLRDDMLELLRRVVRGSIDSAPNADDHIRTLGATMQTDYAALFAAAGEVSGVLCAVAPLSPATQPLTQPATRPVVELPEELRGAVTGDVLAIRKSRSGWIVFGGAGNNAYEMWRLAAVIDLGGDDLYRYAATAGADVQAIIDLAGNDLYDGGDTIGPGAAMMGVSFIVDLAGNDTYRGGTVSCGAGVLGVGVILDRAGDDKYEGITWSQGAGIYGAGAIIDLDGGDVYTAHGFSQAIGGPRGFGLILDAGGSDLYRANGPIKSAYSTPAVFYAMSQGVGFGFRYWDSGGIGILDDHNGNDRYEAGEFAQGGGYFFGMGILHDRAGADVYFGNRYSQGFAAHQAIGLCVDDSGDDSYWGMTAANQSGSWDQSMTVLLDRAGNDTYRGDGLAQGSAAMQAIAWLIDLDGNDHYTAAGTAVQGRGGGNEYHYVETRCLSWSMLIDAGGGADHYSFADRANDKTTATGAINEKSPEHSDAHGVFIDQKDPLNAP